MNLPEADFQKIKEKALRLLARRDHSRIELKMKLRQRMKFDNATFDALVEKLQELGYLVDENKLAQRWIDQWRTEGRGRQWISGKLRLKGLPQITLRDDIAEFESAQTYLKKKLGEKTLPQLDPQERARIARAMQSRGFSIGIIAALIKGKKHVDESGNFQFEL